MGGRWSGFEEAATVESRRRRRRRRRWGQKGAAQGKEGEKKTGDEAATGMKE